MAVQYITYNGKEYPIKLGSYSLRRFQEEYDVELKDLKENEALYEPLLYFALKQGARIEKQELDLELEDMPMVLDDCMVDFALAIPKFFPGEIPDDLKDELKKLKVDGGKERTKKPISTSSKPKH